MTTKLSPAQTILLHRIGEAGDQPFEIAPRARSSAAILASYDLLEGGGDLWRVTDAGRSAIGLPSGSPSAGDGSAPGAAARPNLPRVGTKGALVVEMLGRREGASVAQLSEATAWLPHSVRGFLAGALKKKHGLGLSSEPTADGRIYRLAEASQ